MVGDVHAPQCNKAYTTIQLPASASRKGTASLHVKVDTRAGSNLLPLHVFWCLYPDKISPADLPTGLDHISTRLTAYNRSHIPLYGALHGPITWQPDCPGSQPPMVNSFWYVADTPGPTIPGLPSSEKLAVMKMNCAIMVRWPSTHPAPVSTTAATTKPPTVPEATKSIRSTDDLIKRVPRKVQGNRQIPWQIQDATPSWCTSGDTCPQEMPNHLMAKGQGAPQQDGMPRHDHPCRWTNRLGILYHLCPEGKWQAMSVLGSLWPQQGHLPWSSQDTHCGGSCSQVCTLLLLH